MNHLLFKCISFAGIRFLSFMLVIGLLTNGIAAKANAFLPPITVRGKVLDETGQPAIGASIKVKGKNIAVSADTNGAFTLTNVEDTDILVITYVGYVTQEIKASENVTIRLKPDSQVMEEVVVVGYGTQKKASVTAAIATIDNKTLQQTPVPNITNALTGRMPGLIVQQTSGDPGADAATLLIRGRATLGNVNPLVLVDGVERPLASITSFEVENISILKDASATAVYGVRGANGVILVTTKRGVEGKAKVSMTFNQALSANTRMPDFLNSYEMASLMNEALANEGRQPLYTQQQLDGYKNHSDPYLYPDVDYVKEFLKPYSLQYNLNTNVAGGNKFVKYFVSGSFLNQGGLYKHTDNTEFDNNLKYQRFNFRSNLDMDVAQGLRVSVNMANRAETRNGPRNSTSRLYSLLMRTPPNNGPLLNPDGTFGAGPILGDNVLAEFNYHGFTKDYTNLLEGTVITDLKLNKIVKGLSFKPMLAITNHYRQQTSRFRGGGGLTDFYSKYTITGKDASGNYTYGPNLGSENPILNYGETFISDANNSYRTIYFEGALNYVNSFGKNNVSGLLLVNRQRKTLNNSGFDWPFSYQGIVGRLTYNWDNRYMAEVNMGYNGSEQFPKGSRYGFFPSVSAGWVISSEPFLKNNKTVSFLKLRGSYGQVGNDQLGGSGARFLFFQNPYTATGNYNFGLTNNTTPGTIISEGAFGNPNVVWEKANKANVGLESQWFEGKLKLNAEVFYEERSNILTTPGTVPLTIGSALPAVNIGKVNNRGYEVELGFNTNKKEGINYFFTTNVTYARNKQVYIDEPAMAYPWMRRTGQPIGRTWGLETAGFFNSQAEINAWARSSYDPGALGRLQPGDFKYVDQNKDGVIDIYDHVPLKGPNTPEYIFSFIGGLNVKGFDFNFQLQGATNTAFALNLEAAYEFFNTGKAMKIHQGRWTPATAATATYPRVSSSPTGTQHNYVQNDYWVKNTQYLRIKQAEIGYTFSQNLLDKLKVNGLRLYVNGSNLYTWDNLKYIDPENRVARGWFYPQQIVVNGGINLTF